MVSLYIEVTDEEALFALTRLDTLLNPQTLAVFMAEVVDPYMHQRIRERFDSEGDDASGKWAALRAATQAYRAQQGYGAEHPINVRTGELRSFMEDTPGRAVPDPAGANLFLPGRGASTEVAKKLRTAQGAKQGVVARPVLAMNETDTLAVVSELEAYIRTGVGV